MPYAINKLNGWRIIDSEADLLKDERLSIDEPTEQPIMTVDVNKRKAVGLLLDSDWTASGDVGDSTKANPYLANQSDFIIYRNALRQIALNSVQGNIEFPIPPTEQWVTV
jgi:hypothetical protein